MSKPENGAASPSRDGSAGTVLALATMQSKLNTTRLRLFEADRLLDEMRASRSWRLTAPFRRLEPNRKRLAELALRAAKLAAWMVTGQLSSRVRSWRRSRARPSVSSASAPKLPPSFADPAAPAPPAPGGKTILIVDYAVPKPDQEAGGRCTMAVIEALLVEGWSVTFWPRDRAEGGHYTRNLEALNVPVLDHRFHGGIEAYLGLYGSHFDHIMLMRPHVAGGLLRSVLCASHTSLLSYFGHDLHFARVRGEAAYNDDPDAAHRAERLQAVERAIWRAVDVVLYLSEDEASIVRQLEPGVDARAVTPYAYASFIRHSVPTSGELLLFVGGFNHAPNEDAVLWFAKTILPRVLTARPGAQFAIAGSNPTPAVRALSGPAIEVTGRISDERLSCLYDAARVAVAPLRFGAGVKGKVVEAMRYGVPVVITQIGAQGLPDLPASVPVHDDPTELANAVTVLLAGDAQWLRQSADQVEYAQHHFSLRAMRRSLLAALC